MIGIPFPVCDFCGRPIERMTTWYDPARALHMVAVECHGEREEVSLSLALLDSNPTVRGGVAFRQKIAALAQPADNPL